MPTSFMAQEIAEAPEVIAKQLFVNEQAIRLLAQNVRKFDPSFVYIVGRGSNGHAGIFAKYLIEIELGVPVVAAAPSVTEIYGQRLSLNRALVIIISHSGHCPDVLTQAAMAKKTGALCIALVNDENSPLVSLVDHVVFLHADKERAVVATKSYIATLSTLLQLVGYWKENDSLLSSLHALPDQMRSAINEPQQLTIEFIQTTSHCIVLGRGFGYAIACEVALKLKQVCGVHAEAFSSAEFVHGPIALAENPLSVVNVEVNDESFEAHIAQTKRIIKQGVNMNRLLQSFLDVHPRVAPLIILLRFYLDIENIARYLGYSLNSSEEAD